MLLDICARRLQTVFILSLSRCHNWKESFKSIEAHVGAARSFVHLLARYGKDKMLGWGRIASRACDIVKWLITRFDC